MRPRLNVWEVDGFAAGFATKMRASMRPRLNVWEVREEDIYKHTYGGLQ